MVEFQTRSEEFGLRRFGSLDEAMREAASDKTVWKISFDAVGGERIRLVRNMDNQWVYDPIVVLP